MAIEVRGVNPANKGAHLMLLAIIEQMKRRLSGQRLAVATNVFTREQTNDLELDRLYVPTLEFAQNLRLQHFVPARLLAKFGLLNDAHVDVVLDASGFQCGDQWGTPPMQRLAQAIKGPAAEDVRSSCSHRLLVPSPETRSASS